MINKKQKKDYLDNINALLFVVMVILVLFQVFARFILHISVPWTEELARYFLILVTFTGGAIAVRDRQHLSIFAIFNRLPKQIRYYLNICFNVAITIFLITVLKGSIKMIQLSWESPTGSISWITLGKLYLIVAIIILIILFFSMKQLIWDFRKKI